MQLAWAFSSTEVSEKLDWHLASYKWRQAINFLWPSMLVWHHHMVAQSCSMGWSDDQVLFLMKIWGVDKGQNMIIKIYWHLCKVKVHCFWLSLLIGEWKKHTKGFSPSLPFVTVCLSSFSLFLIFTTITLFKLQANDLVEYSLISIWCFLVIRFRLCIFSRNITEVMLCSHCILLSSIQFCFFSVLVGLTLITWLRCCLSGFSTIKLHFYTL